MAKTIAQLCDEALRRLAVLEVAGNADGDEFVEFKNVYLTALEDLRELGVVYWESNSIPEGVFNRLADYMAVEVASSYGKPRDINLQEYAIKKMRAHVRKAAVDSTTRFMSY